MQLHKLTTTSDLDLDLDSGGKDLDLDLDLNFEDLTTSLAMTPVRTTKSPRSYLAPFPIYSMHL